MGRERFLFATFVPGAANVDARVGVGLPGFEFGGLGKYGGSAQLYSFNAGTYTALLPATTFRTDNPTAEFYVVPPADAVVVPGIGAGEQATIVMRAWIGASTYEQAIAAGTIRGETPPHTITLGGIPADGGAPLPPAFLTGLQGFIIVPEPSVISLALVGVAALLLGKRKC